MYEVTIITKFGAAHQLRDFGGKCENLHGHNWKVEVSVRGSELDKAGLLMDFGIVKDATKNVIESLDHTFLNQLPYFTEINPSSENIARYIFQALQKKINAGNVTVSKVSAWESDSAYATYSEECIEVRDIITL